MITDEEIEAYSNRREAVERLASDIGLRDNERLVEHLMALEQRIEDLEAKVRKYDRLNSTSTQN